MNDAIMLKKLIVQFITKKKYDKEMEEEGRRLSSCRVASRHRSFFREGSEKRPRVIN